MGRGKLIVIDGLDGTGKATQVKMAIDEIIERNSAKNCAAIDFPRYGHQSCTMVEKYLKGDFCQDPNDVDPYTASMMYAIDRSISYNTEHWGEVYRSGGLIIADRYTCSNIIHQASKLSSASINKAEYLGSCAEFCNYINWLYDLEYNKIGVPVPDLIIYLTSSKEANEKLLNSRKDSAIEGDIHEADLEYQDKCRLTLNAYKILSSDIHSQIHFNLDIIFKKMKHEFIDISDNHNNIRSKEDIHNEIMNIIYKQIIFK